MMIIFDKIPSIKTGYQKLENGVGSCLTKDESIGRNPTERRAVALTGARMFNVASKGLSGEELAIAFRDALPSMLKFIAKNQAPFVAKVYKDSRVSNLERCDRLA